MIYNARLYYSTIILFYVFSMIQIRLCDCTTIRLCSYITCTIVLLRCYMIAYAVTLVLCYDIVAALEY